MRGYLKWSWRQWVRTTLRAIGRMPGCSPIHARSPSATWFPEQLTCSAHRLSAPPAPATGAIRSRVWPRRSLSLWERVSVLVTFARSSPRGVTLIPEEASYIASSRRISVSRLIVVAVFHAGAGSCATGTALVMYLPDLWTRRYITKAVPVVMYLPDLWTRS